MLGHVKAVIEFTPELEGTSGLYNVVNTGSAQRTTSIKKTLSLK